jgi:hypothetical protein
MRNFFWEMAQNRTVRYIGRKEGSKQGEKEGRKEGREGDIISFGEMAQNRTVTYIYTTIVDYQNQGIIQV